MDLARDDWELTLNDLKSQRVQLELQTAVVDMGIVGIEKILAKFPKKSVDEMEEGVLVE